MKQEIDTLLNLAYIYMNYGKVKRAVDYLLIAHRLDPQNIQIKKMKIAAFHDLGAFSEALDIISDLEMQNLLNKNDMITMKLMKSFCLQGLNRIDEGRAVFSEYIKERKDVATKEFIKKYRRQLVREAENDTSSDDIDTAQDMRQFVQNRS